jgi:hypothetical protein
LRQRRSERHHRHDRPGVNVVRAFRLDFLHTMTVQLQR